MSTQTLIDLFGKLREDENAHKVISLLHLMLHLGAEQLEGGDQAPAPICVQTRELLEQKAIVKKLSETVDHQKTVISGQLEQKTKDLNMQVMDLHKKNTLMTEMNKRLYMKCKSLEGKYEEIYHQHKSIKEELEEQRCLTLGLQQRLEKLETMKNTKDDLPGSEDVREKSAFKTVGGLYHQVTVPNRELKKETSLILDHQQRLDRSAGVRHQDAMLDTKKKDNSQPQAGQKESSSKAGKENSTEKEKEKQCKMTANPHDASEAVQGQQSSERKEASAAPHELLKLRPRNDCEDKVAAGGRTGVKAKQIFEDGGSRKLKNATLLKAPIDKLAAERKTTADKRKPQVNLKDTKPVKVTPLFETKECTVPQLVNKDKTLPFQKSFMKEILLPGRGNFNRSRTTVTNTVQASRQASLRNAIKVSAAKTRTFNCAPLEMKPLFQHSSLKHMGANGSTEVVTSERINRSPLFKVANIGFKRDEDFSPWKHDNVPEPIIYFGQDNEGAEP